MTNHPSNAPSIAPKARRLPKDLRLRLLQLKEDNVVELPEVIKGMTSKEYESLVKQNVSGPGVYRIQFRSPLARREALKLERFITAGFKFKKYQPTTWDKYAKGPSAPYIGLRPCTGLQCPARKALLLFPSSDGSTNEGPYISATFHIPPFSDHTCLDCAASHDETTSAEEPSTFDEESARPASPAGGSGAHLHWFSPAALDRLKQQPAIVPLTYDDDSATSPLHTPPLSPSDTEASSVSSPTGYDLNPSGGDLVLNDSMGGPHLVSTTQGVVSVSLNHITDLVPNFYSMPDPNQTLLASSTSMISDPFDIMQDVEPSVAYNLTGPSPMTIASVAAVPVSSFSFSFSQVRTKKAPQHPSNR